jgi:hypothetical protein
MTAMYGGDEEVAMNESETERLARSVNNAIDANVAIFLLCMIFLAAAIQAALIGAAVGFVWRPAGWVVGVLVFPFLFRRLWRTR